MTDKELRRFYELCQVYRHTPVTQFKETRDAYDALVSFVTSLSTVSKETKSREEVIGLVQCAEMNLMNLARAEPIISYHPYFKIVKYQLACARLDNDKEPISIEDDQKET